MATGKNGVRQTQGRGKLYDSIVDTIGDTPCVRINHLAPEGATIYVKAEFFNPAASVKDRLALNIIEAAERDGSLKPGQTVVEATSGNTGIGLAMVCAAKGYPLVVTMAESFSVERRQVMRFLGAKVILTPRAQKGTGMYMKAKELADAHGWFLARQFETAANADIHESTTAREIIGDFAGKQLDYFVSGYGTGGTVSGVGRILKKTWPNAKIILSEPSNAQLVGSGTAQQRSEDGGPAVSHPAFEPHPIQGWTPDFIPLVLQEAIDGRYFDELIPISRRRGDEMGAGAGGEGGHHDRRLRGRHLRGGDGRRRARAGGLGDPRDAARHRRALPFHAALRALRRRHERRGAGDFALHAGLPDGLARSGLVKRQENRCLRRMRCNVLKRLRFLGAGIQAANAAGIQACHFFRVSKALRHGAGHRGRWCERCWPSAENRGNAMDTVKLLSPFATPALLGQIAQ